MSITLELEIPMDTVESWLRNHTKVSGARLRTDQALLDALKTYGEAHSISWSVLYESDGRFIKVINFDYPNRFLDITFSGEGDAFLFASRCFGMLAKKRY